MKNYFTSLFPGIFLLLLAAACSDNRQELTIAGQGIKFTSNISGSVAATRAANDTWEPDDQIGVYMIGHQPSGGDADLENAIDENVGYQTTAGGTSATFEAVATALEFPVNGNNVNFVAYYPYLDNVHSTYSNSYPVNVSTQDPLSGIDLLYYHANTPYNKGSQSVPLRFEHQLSKLVINVKPEDGFDIDLTDAETSLTGIPTTAQFALASGNLHELGGTARPTTLVVPVKNEASSKELAVFEAIIIPHEGVDYPSTSGNPRTLYFEAEGKEYSYTFPDSQDMETGVAYNYTFVLSNTGLVFTEVTIADWNSEEHSGGFTPSPNKVTVNEPIPASLEIGYGSTVPHAFVIRTNSVQTHDEFIVEYSTAGTPHTKTELPGWLTMSTPSPLGNINVNATDWQFSFNITEAQKDRTFYIHVNIDGYEKIVQVKQKAPFTTTEDGLSNCYILAPGQTITIPIDRAITHGGMASTGQFVVYTLWDSTSCIQDGEGLYPIEDGVFTITAGSRPGNALLVLEDETATLRWSYHIWVTDMDQSKTFTNELSTSPYRTFMDRNLGALTNELGEYEYAAYEHAHGVFYQWGRKEPLQLNTTIWNPVRFPSVQPIKIHGRSTPPESKRIG